MLNKNTILIIDDDKSWQKILADIFSYENISTICCNTVKKGLEILQKNPINVVILDLKIGDEDGMTVLEHLKQINPNIKIIIFTGFATLETAMAAVNKEVFAYIEKMDNMEKLIAHVHRAISEHYENYSDKLEQEIKIHTAELRIKNEKLRKDIITRKKIQEQLKSTIKEREVLLKEVHHRVKNNLQLICSLLNMQSHTIFDPRDKDLFLDSINRVRSMALVHESLYGSEDLANIDMKQYVNKLVIHLFQTYHKHYGKIQSHVDINKILLTIDTAIPLGLLIDELLTNSFKYAFPDNQQGDIYISLKLENDKYILIVKDNGIGLPKDYNPKESKTLGTDLIYTLIKQIKASITVDNSVGTCYTITFPPPKIRNLFKYL